MLSEEIVFNIQNQYRKSGQLSLLTYDFDFLRLRFELNMPVSL
jgi:hypothetical protein